MSAETIPAEVRELAAHYKEVWINEAKTLDHVITLAILADRSTRPAEPAAPVAEAGEVVAWGVEMYGFWELCNDEETARYRHEPARKVEPLVRLSALEAERARADAAEHRAAVALARAEKAAEDERDRLYTKAQASNTAEFLIRHGAMLPADRARLRALREAQPATDGGDNG